MITLDQEPRQNEENRAAPQESGQDEEDRPVLDSATADLLDTLQQLRASSERQLANLIRAARREPNGTFQEQDRILIQQETQSLHSLEKGVKKFLEGGHK